MLENKIKAGTYLLSLVLLNATGVFAQTDKYSLDGFSVNPKLGFYNPFTGPMAGLELNFIKLNRIVYSVHYYHYETTFSPEKIDQIGALIGKYIGNETVQFHYQGGLSYIWGTKEGEYITDDYFFGSYEKVKIYSPGLAVKVGFKVIPLTFLSAGIDFEANINLAKTIFTPSVNIGIGTFNKNTQ